MSFQIILLTFCFHFCPAQNFALDTRELNDLVKKWNNANNLRSEETFQSLYLNQLTFYAQRLTRERCIALKRKFFREHPEYKQRIVSDPVFTPYTSGVIKCEFIKESFQNKAWKKYPSYLLITYEKNQYYISGESDLQTDSILKYNLDIGEPMDIPQYDGIDLDKDSIFQNDTIATIGHKSEDSILLREVSKEVLSEEIVPIPKKYLYFLIGFLILTASILLLWKPGKGSNNRKVVKTKGVILEKEAVIVRNETVIVRNEKGFESFVISLFDPHYFTLRAFSEQKALAGNANNHENLPFIEFEFLHKEFSARIFVECLFIPEMIATNVLSMPGKQLIRNLDLQEAQGIEVYVIIGLGGEPDNPKEIYVLRSGDMGERPITHKDLQPYRKFGMFFYSVANRRLQ